MKIAIIGGAGFVGSHLTRAYLNAGHDVFVVDSLVCSTHQALDSRARFYHMDMRDGKLQAILQSERPDLVSYHAILREQILPCESSLLDADIHIRGLLNVLESCVSAQVSKLIFASGGNSLYRGCSLQELGTARPISEEIEPCPLRPRDINRIAGEWYIRYYARQYALPYLILRYADIYGEIDVAHASHPLTSFLAKLSLRSRPAIRGGDQNVRDHIFIDDVVRANMCALERGYNETLHISTAQGYSIRQFYQAASRLLQCDIPPLTISAPFAEPDAVILDNRRAQRILNWQPEVGLPTGVQLAAQRLLSQKTTGALLPVNIVQENGTRSAVLV
ncbi:MAG TPA: NAD-dependent epimerase/dehydratase family protein [Ktedonobacteraceae bacterium]|nr:NAD-dependent epimerase/dehydratase family protein [Ktedonobacteraceae bacterium]